MGIALFVGLLLGFVDSDSVHHAVFTVLHLHDGLPCH
jgi:hypothetical protein